MRTAAIAAIVTGLLAGSVWAQTAAPVVIRPAPWQKSLSPRKALAADDARARGRAAYLSGKSPEALVAEIRAAHPAGGDEIVATALKEARATGKAEVEALKGDGLTELAEAEQLKMQAAMDRLSKFEQTLSNILKRMAETQGSVAGNLK